MSKATRPVRPHPPYLPDPDDFKANVEFDGYIFEFSKIQALFEKKYPTEAFSLEKIVMGGCDAYGRPHFMFVYDDYDTNCRLYLREKADHDRKMAEFKEATAKYEEELAKFEIAAAEETLRKYRK